MAFYLKRSAGGPVQGPFSQDKILSLASKGLLEPGMVLSDDKIKWYPCEQVDFLAELLGTGSPDASLAVQQVNAVQVVDEAGPAQGVVLPAAYPEVGAQLNAGDRPKSSTALTVSIIAFVIVLLCAIGTGIYYFWRSRQGGWVPRVVANATNSVVLISSSKGIGSGFVVASLEDHHLILTNRHVAVAGKGDKFGKALIPDEVSVCPRVGGPRLVGKVAAKAADKEVDLALVLVNSKLLKPLGGIKRFEYVRVGEPVIALGNPTGLEFTVTEGIVSGKRGIDYIQTTAALNPGSSGGPLISKEGKVMGVNTLFVRGMENMGFAISTDRLLSEDQWAFDIDVREILRKVPR